MMRMLCKKINVADYCRILQNVAKCCTMLQNVSSCSRKAGTLARCISEHPCYFHLRHSTFNLDFRLVNIKVTLTIFDENLVKQKSDFLNRFPFFVLRE